MFLRDAISISIFTKLVLTQNVTSIIDFIIFNIIRACLMCELL